MKKVFQKNKGNLLVLILIFSSVSVYMLSALVTSANTNLVLSRQTVNRELALKVAEAGIDYYRWHLAHAPTDYKNGTSSPGPYVHEYYDKDGNAIGRYSLTITPPIVGSTLVTIKSKGEVYADLTTSRTIQEQLAIPSFARFAVVANDEMRFGAGTEIFGPIHSNDGIRFDGVAHNIISSARTTYIDPDSGMNSYGVHTAGDPSPSVGGTVPSRPDIFLAGRQFPVAASDFAGITVSLAQIKSQAQIGGRYFAPSGYYGYRIRFKKNNTFDLYRVTNLLNPPGGCSNSLNQTGWGTWSIASGGEVFVQNYPIPSNGLIFVEDHVWVDGQIDGDRVTVAAGTFPDNANKRKNIIVNSNLLYTSVSGTDVISLIAQDNILVGLRSADSLTIHAALMAQNGFAGRYYYRSQCGSEQYRSTLNLFGMIGTNKRYGFAYTDGTGYNVRNINYDARLLYSPPPSFPLSTNQYEIISWKEI